MTARRLWPLLFVLGVVLMVPFEATITRILGMACLLAFVVVGLFLVTAPDLKGSGPAADERRA